MSDATLLGLSHAPSAPAPRRASASLFPDVVSRLKETFSAPDYQPPLLPAVATQVLELARDPDVELPKVIALLETEPLLLGKVMRTAQSPLYRAGRAIDTIEAAVVRLGLQELAAIVIEAALHLSIFNSKTFAEPMEALRRHSVATGHLAKHLCQKLGQKAERAFLCGLLHDAGLAAAMIAAAELEHQGAKLRLDDIRLELGMVHEEASGILGRLWALPPGMRWVLEHHHHYQLSQHVSPLAAVVCLADWLVAENGAPALEPLEAVPGLQAAEYFGFDHAAVQELGRSTQAIVADLT